MTEQEYIDNGYRKYTGEKVDVYFNKDICEHAGKCVKGSPKVFDLERKPWILPDNESEEDLTALIDTCPSGALKYIIKD